MKHYFTDSNTKPLAILATVLFAILVLFTVWFIGMPSRQAGHYYGKSAEVTEIDLENNIVIFEDPTGNLWEWEGVEDWFTGDRAALVMNDQGTATIYDDAILNVKYMG